MDKTERFSYWKRPRHKWFVLIAGIVQLICLGMNTNEYRELSEAGIFSASEWERYAMQNSMQCAFTGMAAGIFLGTFMIGAFVRSKKAARIAEGALLMFLALAWAAAGFALRLAESGGYRIAWALMLLLTLGGGIYSFWRGRSI